MNPTHATTRREAIAGIGIALSTAITRASAQQAPMQEPPPNTADRRTSIHQEIELKGTPERLYSVLLDSKKFAAFTGLPAEIETSAGGTFKTFGGLIEGRNVELIADQRIVQAWRPASWPAGIYSLVHFELKASGTGTTLNLDHTGFPEGDYDHLLFGWNHRYWEPLKKYLAAAS
ncbi:MAG TPA: SRPBCC family protein [Terracidiphilus sp.]|jgi:activator of HSP90 ATPase